jgi:4-hydroxybenzoate polyprenyltransferase
MMLLALLSLALGLVLMTNALTVLLAFAAVLTALSYPFFKRVVHWPQVVLGLAFSWAIPMAFAAELGHLPAIVWWLMAINLVWVLIYDTQYAMADRADDIQAGIKSLAVWLGPRDLPVLGVLMGVMSALLLLIGLQFVSHPAWFVATLAVMVMLQRQLWQIRTRQPEACFKAFLGNHWVGLVIFLGAALSLR